jgi:lipopolysaccharide export system protein LptC
MTGRRPDPGADGGDATRDRLARLADRPARRVGGGRSYSVFVRIAKRVLPLVALGLIALVVLWPQLEEVDAPSGPAEVDRAAPGGDSTIVNPRYTSIDEAGRPFTIHGTEARQGEAGPQVVEIENPEAEMTLSGGGWASLLADFGVYDREADDVYLRGNVEIFRDDGYAMRTEEMHIDLGEGTAWGDAPVEAAGPGGTIRSQGFRVGPDGEAVIFTGQSRMVLRGAEPGTQTEDVPEVMP